MPLPNVCVCVCVYLTFHCLILEYKGEFLFLVFSIFKNMFLSEHTDVPIVFLPDFLLIIGKLMQVNYFKEVCATQFHLDVARRKNQ